MTTMLVVSGAALIIAVLMWIRQPVTDETDAVYYDPDEVFPARQQIRSDYQPWPGDQEFRDVPIQANEWEYDED